MASHKTDAPAFYKLIRKQRKQPTATTETLTTQDGTFTSTEDILQAWMGHFDRLSTPSDRPHYDSKFQETVAMESLCIESLAQTTPATLEPVTVDQVEKSIRGLNNNKAPDARGLTAEHLKLGSRKIIQYTTSIINNIIYTREVPNILKEGILTPVPKKGKDQRVANNYRGITVTAVLSKIIENLLEPQLQKYINPKINRLQRGFTENTSPNNAALIVTECINEAMDTKTPLALATLDAEKAFDVVWHDGLFRKLYHAELPSDPWLLMRDLQLDAPTIVKWRANVSDPFMVQQGIRQGAKLSPNLYKCFNNGILEALDANKVGAHIGATFIGAPTVADDIALLATDPEDLCVALQVIGHFNSKDRANVNTTKSEVVIYNADPKRQAQKWKLGAGTISETTSTTHLGVLRHQKLKQNIEERIGTGRRALYSLMGAGLHGRNGINPATSYHMYVTFARPRIIYGLETTQLKNQDIKQLQVFEQKTLRQIQYLPDRCATTPVFALLGATPIDTQIEVNALTLFGSIIRNAHTAEAEIAKRQLAMKDEKSRSWFNFIRTILEKYGLPSGLDLQKDPPGQAEWKLSIQDAVNKHLKEKWTKDVEAKPSLRYLSIQDHPTPTPHPLWATVGSKPRHIKEATVKVRVLTGTYTLQANKHKFNQHQVDPTCLLCRTEGEDRKHFLTTCPALTHAREKHLQRLESCIEETAGADARAKIMQDTEMLTRTILDCQHQTVTNVIGSTKSLLTRIEKISRSLTYDLHTLRNKLLKELERKSQ